MKAIRRPSGRIAKKENSNRPLGSEGYVKKMEKLRSGNLLQKTGTEIKKVI